MVEAFDMAWGVVKGWEEEIRELERQMESKPADMCMLCDADLNEEANLSPQQHRAMLETGGFPDVCIKCQKEHGISGDF